MNLRLSHKTIIATLLVISVIVFMVYPTGGTSPDTDQTSCRNENIFIFKSTIDSLLKKGVDTIFITQLLSDDKTKFDEKYIKINVTGYLKKTDYSHFYNDKSVKKNTEFMKEYSSLLQAAANKYNVPMEVIAAILWVETKHGDYLGNNQLPSVFLSTSLVQSPEYINLNIATIDSTQYSKKEYGELVKKIYARSAKKANWAINELVAMYKAQKKYGIDFTKTYGSWAGAFGMSQFLPSSYLQYAVDGNGDDKIDLFCADDAIFSVANYLKSHGWGQTEEQQKKAVFSYNNSNAYVEAVLTLAKKSN